MLDLADPDTVYVVDRSALTADQLTALPLAKSASSTGARLRLSSAEMQTLRAQNAPVPVEEIGLRYQWKASTQSESGSNGLGFDNDIQDGATAYMGVDISGAPSGQIATRAEYSWQLDHDQVTDLRVRLGTSSWNDGFVGVNKTGDNGFLATYSEASNESRESTVDNNQPVNQQWLLVADDTDGGDGNTGHIDAFDLTIFYVVKDETSLSLSVSDASVPWNDEVTFTAELTTGGFFGSSVNGKPIELQLDRQTIYMGQTGDDGSGTVEVTVPAPASVGSFTARATFSGDAGYVGAEDQENLTTEPHDTRIQVDDATGTEGESTTLTARLVDDSGTRDDGEGVGGQRLVFFQQGQLIGSAKELGSATTDGSGEAEFRYDPVQLKALAKANSQNDPILVEFEGSRRYNASSGEGTLTIIEQTPTSLSLSVTPQDGPWGREVDLEADLGVGADDLLVGFYVDGNRVGSDRTSNGVARLSENLPERVGDVEVEARFDGESPYGASSDRQTVTAAARATSVSVPNVQVREDEDVTLQATLVDESSAPGRDRSGLTLVFYQETTATSNCALGVQCAKIGSATTDASGAASLVYQGAEPTGPTAKAVTDTDAIYVDFEGTTTYEASAGRGDIQFLEPTPVQPSFTQLSPYPTPNSDGTIEVGVRVNGEGRSITSVTAYYRTAGTSSSQSTELASQGGGEYTATLPKGGFFQRDYFNDREQIEYWFTATNENGTEARFPSSGVFDVTAVIGGLESNLVLQDPGQNLLDVEVVDRTVTGADRLRTTLRLTNKTFLNWGLVFSKRGGGTIDPGTVNLNNSNELAESLTLLKEKIAFPNESEWSDVFLRGNRYQIPPPFRVDEQFVEVTLETALDDRVYVDLERTHWVTDVLSLLQIVRGTIEAKPGKRDIRAHPGAKTLSQYSEAQRKLFSQALLDAFKEALFLRLAKDLKEKPGELATDFPTMYNTFTGQVEVPGYLDLLQSLGLYVSDLLTDPKFFEAILKAGGSSLSESTTGYKVGKVAQYLGNFAAAASGTKLVTEGISQSRNIYEGLTLPGNDRLVIEHRPALSILDGLVGPRVVPSDAYPDAIRGEAELWLTARPGQSGEPITFVLRNEGSTTLDNVWVGVDVWTPSSIGGASIRPGRKVDNTRTPIPDPTTGKIGTIDFQAYDCDGVCGGGQPLPDDQTYTDPETGESYGQGVSLKPGESVELRADYAFDESVTGHTFEPGTYFMRYIVWHNGYPGSDTGQPLTSLQTETLYMTDNAAPQAPLSGENPFGLSARGANEGVALSWIGPSVTDEPDLAFVRLSRSVSGGPFEDIAWLPAQQFQFVDKSILPSEQEGAEYRVTYVDNAGDFSAVSDVTSVEPYDEATATEVAFVNSNRSVDFTGPGVEMDVAGLTRGGLFTVKYFNADDAPNASWSCSTSEWDRVSPYAWTIDDGLATISADTRIRFALSSLAESGGVDTPSGVAVLHDPPGDGACQTIRPADVEVDDRGTSTTTDDVLIVDGLTSFGTFRFAGNGAGPLPVELARFEGRATRDDVQLTWTTLSETNNDRFILQRTEDPVQGWKNAGEVDGAGTSQKALTYRFTDTTIPYDADELHYRLRQVDADGDDVVISKTVVQRSGPSEAELLGTYPNPARTTMTVRMGAPESQRVTVRLFDILGREVRTVYEGRLVGRRKSRIDVSSLAPGTYFLRMETEGAIRTQKLTIVR